MPRQTKKLFFFQTLSEPTAKRLLYLSQFGFFSPEKLADSVEFVDLGEILRAKGLEHVCELIMEHIRRLGPAFVVIDSFKAFEDLCTSVEEFRKFSYQIAVNLMVWECTSFLLGEYSATDIQTSPLFSVIDGMIMLSQKEESGEQQRFIQVVKMRGVKHDLDSHPFVISEDGIEVFAPSVTIKPTSLKKTKEMADIRAM